jgi:hypothetical protein
MNSLSYRPAGEQQFGSGPSAQPSQVAKDVWAIASERARHGNAVAERLERIALTCESEPLWAEAERLRQCSAHWNLFIARGIDRDDGVTFDGTGTLWRCNSRLCHSCAAELSRRNRRRTREVIEYVEALRKKSEIERWSLITLTVPKVAGQELKTILEVCSRAFALLRKRRFWGNSINTGIRSVEWTLGDKEKIPAGRTWSFKLDGYSVDMHLLIYADFMPLSELRPAWTESITKAWAERGVRLEIKSRSKLARVQINNVVDRDDTTDETISKRKAMFMVGNYVCKPKVLLELPDDQLAAVASIEKWPRMFDTLGSVRGKTKNASSSNLVTKNVNAAPTKRNGKRGPSLKALAKEMPIADWTKVLHLRVNKTRAYRRRQLVERYPLTDIELLDGEILDPDL